MARPHRNGRSSPMAMRRENLVATIRLASSAANAHVTQSFSPCHQI